MASGSGHGRGGRSLMPPLLAVNLVVYLIILGLAGWSFDKFINGEQNHPHLGGNPSTSFMLVFGVIGGVMGACSVVAGLLHHLAWTTRSLAAAASSAITSWALTALAFGVVCKEIILGGHRGKRLQTLEAFITISVVSQLLYLVLLHAGMFNPRYGPAYGPMAMAAATTTATTTTITTTTITQQEKASTTTAFST